MLIDEENIRVQYDSTAESPIMEGDPLPFPFRYIEKEQIKAMLLDGTELVFEEDYTVGYPEEEKPEGEDEASVSADTTVVIMKIDIPIGETITLYRETALDQTSEFPQEARFSSRKIEDALDKLTMQNQEQREALARALKLPLTAPIDVTDLALPNPEPNKSVKWNADGTALVNTNFDPDTALITTENFKQQAETSAKNADDSARAASNSATIAKSYSDTIEAKGDKIIKDADAIIHRVGLNMFDTVIKDHKLTYPNDQGLALQGTWVYRDAKAGERYGYPDFYNTCVKEFKESGAYENNISVTGTITNNNGVISGFSNNNYFKLPSLFDATQAWEIVIKVKTTVQGRQEILGRMPNEGDFATLLLRVDPNNKFFVNASTNGTDWLGLQLLSKTLCEPNKEYTIKIEYTKAKYALYINGVLEAQTSLETPIVMTGDMCFGQSAGNNYALTNGSIDLNECYININGSRWWDGVRLRRHSNGHYYYPISAKETIDSRFNSNGAAWYYGVDEVNKRIFLPRNNWFMQMASNSVGAYANASSISVSVPYSGWSLGTTHPGKITAGVLLAGSGKSESSETLESIYGTAANRAASVTINPNPLQPKSVKYLLYICVGNQIAKDSWVDTITQVKNGAKDIDDSVQGAIADVEQAKDECIAEIGTKTAELTSKMAFSMFDTLIKDYKITYPNDQGFALQGTYVYHDADPGIRYGYPDFYNKCLEEFNQATSTSTVNNVTVKIHSNGHKYYNISDKTAIDSYYTSTGSAWFYGIDTANKRIFLPRDKYFAIKNSASTVQVRGNGKTVGFTDGTTQGGLYTSAGAAYITSPCYGMSVGETRGTGQLGEKLVVGVTTDPAKSGMVANTGSILQTHGEKYLYICVGNRLQDTSWIDVATQVENGIKDIDEVYQRDLAGINSAYNSAMNTLQAVGPVLQTGSTMTGSLKIKNAGLDLFSTKFVKGEHPSVTVYNGIRFNDANSLTASKYQSTRIGLIESCVKTDGSTQMIIGTVQNVAEASGMSKITLEYNVNGMTYCDFPKCTTKATTTSSAASNKVAVVVQNYVNGTSWYRIWSDGWIEQGAWLQGSWNKSSQFTLVKSFSNNNYTLVANVGAADVGSDCVVLVANKTASNFYIESSRGTAGNYTFKQIYYYAAGY